MGVPEKLMKSNDQTHMITCHYLHWICWVQNLSTFRKSIQCSGSWRSWLAAPEPGLLKMPVLFHSYSKQQKVYTSFFPFQPMINFSMSSTFRARVSLKDGKPTYQRAAGADPTLWTHLTFSFCDSRHELFPNSFILAPWKGSAQISV